MYYTYSDSENSYILTESERERIEQKNAEASLKKQNERKSKFENMYEKLKDKQGSIFNYDGLSIVTFNSMKIKYMFHPCSIPGIRRLNPKLVYYFSLRYNEIFDFWTIKNNTLAAECQMKIYKLFQLGAPVTDGDIKYVITEICELLQEWSWDYHKFQMDKIKKYRRGKDIHFTSDDEELLLNPEEVTQRRRKRDEILKRMIPPTKEEIDELNKKLKRAKMALRSDL